MDGKSHRNQPPTGASRERTSVENETSGGGNFSFNSVTTGNSSNLQDSEFSVDSTDAADQNRESGGWFSGVGADLRNIAHCLTDNVAPVVSGVFGIAHRTAVAVANEIAQLEHDGNIDDSDALNNDSMIESSSTKSFDSTAKSQKKKKSLTLPWEIKKKAGDDVPVYFTDDALMEDILALSLDESTFLKPFRLDEESEPECALDLEVGSTATSSAAKKSSRTLQSSFTMDEGRIKLIQRLMDIDKNLACMHSRFSGKSHVREKLFWKNYFYHCKEIRNERLGRGHNTARPGTGTSSKLFSVVETIVDDCDMRQRLDRVVSSIAGDEDSNEDSESLVLADSASEADDSSYVIASAPNSVNTFTTSRSIDDMVVINSSADSRGKR